MSHPPVTVAALAGVWQRELNYEPVETVADSTARDGSTVLWGQAPDGTYVDVRRVKSEQFRVRGFSGRSEIAQPGPDADPTTFTTTWHRHTDTMPESCPSGLDSARCRVVGDLAPGASPMLMEEGDGYLEVWRRIAVWDADRDKVTVEVAATEKGERLTSIALSIDGIVFGSDKASVSVLRSGTALSSNDQPAQ
jgi:hypothetical protein